MNWMKVRKYLPNFNGYTSEKVILYDSSDGWVMCGRLIHYKNGKMKWQTDKGTYSLEEFTHWSYIDKPEEEIK